MTLFAGFFIFGILYAMKILIVEDDPSLAKILCYAPGSKPMLTQLM